MSEVEPNGTVRRLPLRPQAADQAGELACRHGLTRDRAQMLIDRFGHDPERLMPRPKGSIPSTAAELACNPVRHPPWYAMFLIQGRNPLSSISVGTDRAATALATLQELTAAGMKEVVVSDRQGRIYSRDELAKRAEDDLRVAPFNSRKGT